MKQQSAIEKAIQAHLKKMDEAKPGLLKRLLEDKNLIHNLIMMNIVWIAASFIFFLIGFLVKYMPGDIYFNSLMQGLSAFAMLLQG